MGNLTQIQELAKKNAKYFLEEAEDFEEKKKWGRAYAFLIFALEELAKHQIAIAYESKLFGIEDNKLDEMFTNHFSKRKTVVTQALMSLMNTFDKDKKSRIMTAIKEANPNKDEEVQKLVSIFKNIQKMRNKGIYVEKDGSSPSDITEENYIQMKGVTKKCFKGIDSFVAPKNFNYYTFETQVARLIDW